MSRPMNTGPDMAAAQCGGKHRFSDGGLAKKVASQSSRRKDSSLKAYRCAVCGGWHIGQNTGGKRPPMRKYK